MTAQAAEQAEKETQSSDSLHFHSGGLRTLALQPRQTSWLDQPKMVSMYIRQLGGRLNSVPDADERLHPLFPYPARTNCPACFADAACLQP